jgi:hypothetical protein
MYRMWVLYLTPICPADRGKRTGFFSEVRKRHGSISKLITPAVY